MLLKSKIVISVIISSKFNEKPADHLNTNCGVNRIYVIDSLIFSLFGLFYWPLIEVGIVYYISNEYNRKYAGLTVGVA